MSLPIYKGLCEVGISMLAGLVMFAPIPPLAVVIAPVCGLASLVSVLAERVLGKMMDFRDFQYGEELKIGVKVLIILGVTAAIGVGLSIPLSPAFGVPLAMVIGIACAVGAIAANRLFDDEYYPAYYY